MVDSKTDGVKMIKGNTNIREALVNVVNVIGYGNLMMIAQDLKLRLMRRNGMFVFYIPNSLFRSEYNISNRYQLVDEEEVVGILMQNEDITKEITISLEVA